MDMTPVSSSNISAIGYDEETNELRVSFNGGATYSYAGVPLKEYKALMQSGSKGKYLHNVIRPAYGDGKRV